MFNRIASLTANHITETLVDRTQELTAEAESKALDEARNVEGCQTDIVDDVSFCRKLSDDMSIKSTKFDEIQLSRYRRATT